MPGGSGVEEAFGRAAFFYSGSGDGGAWAWEEVGREPGWGG